MQRAGLHPIKEERALYWKYWRERSDWSGPRSLVLTKGEEIVGHAGIVPGTLAWTDRRATVIHVIDWAAIPEAALGGRMLMKYAGGLADYLIAAGGSEDTLRMLPVLGFQHCGTTYRYVRTLHPLRYLTSQAHWNWKTLPKFARDVLRTIGTPAAKLGAWRSRQLAPEQLQGVVRVLPRPLGAMPVFERNLDLFSYFLDCPTAVLTLHGVEHSGDIRGYFLLACVMGQARIVDSWLDCSDADAWLALVQCAIEAAQRIPGVAEIVTTESDPLVSQCLRACHFRQRSAVALQILTRKGLESPSSCPRVQMLDSDAAYHHPGFAEFWN